MWSSLELQQESLPSHRQQHLHLLLSLLLLPLPFVEAQSHAGALGLVQVCLPPLLPLLPLLLLLLVLVLVQGLAWQLVQRLAPL